MRTLVIKRFLRGTRFKVTETLTPKYDLGHPFRVLQIILMDVLFIDVTRLYQDQTLVSCNLARNDDGPERIPERSTTLPSSSGRPSRLSCETTITTSDTPPGVQEEGGTGHRPGTRLTTPDYGRSTGLHSQVGQLQRSPVCLHESRRGESPRVDSNGGSVGVGASDVLPKRKEGRSRPS